MVGRERLIIYLTGLFLCVAAFGYSYLRFGAGPPRPREPQSQTRLETVVQEGAEVVLRYVAAGDEVAWSEVVPVDQELVGLSLAELRGVRPHWNVQSFAPNRLVVDVPCSPEGPGGFIAERDGHIAIYTGSPRGCHVLRELTGIEVDALPDEAREAVRGVIVYDDPQDVPQILDGLTSTR